MRKLFTSEEYFYILVAGLAHDLNHSSYHLIQKARTTVLKSSAAAPWPSSSTMSPS